MSRFKVQLRGSNLLLSSDGEHAKYGFTATRVVRAGTPEEAGRMAIIRMHQQLNQNEEIVKHIPDKPVIHIVSCEKLRFYQAGCLSRSSGFEFFPEDPACQPCSSLI